jgi:hypothetical protein
VDQIVLSLPARGRTTGAAVTPGRGLPGGLTVDDLDAGTAELQARVVQSGPVAGGRADMAGKTAASTAEPTG